MNTGAGEKFKLQGATPPPEGRVLKFSITFRAAFFVLGKCFRVPWGSVKGKTSLIAF